MDRQWLNDLRSRSSVVNKVLDWAGNGVVGGLALLIVLWAYSNLTATVSLPLWVFVAVGMLLLGGVAGVILWMRERTKVQARILQLVGHYFKRQQSLDSLVRQTQFDRVWLIPSDNSLVQSDAGIAAGPGAEVRFVRDLHAAGMMPPAVLDTRSFDWIILDTGPSMGLFTRAAIAASHYVLMPIEPGVFTDLGAI